MSDTEEKTKPATARKLNKLRQDGQIAMAAEAGGLLALAAGTAVVLGLAGTGLSSLTGLFDVVDEAMRLPFDEALRAAPAAIARQVLWVLGPLTGAVLAASVLFSLIYNKGLVLSAKPIAPKMERISPLSGLKRIYGRRGWIETAATVVRLAVWLSFVALVAWIWLPRLAGAAPCGLPCQARAAIPPAWLLGIGIIAVALLAAGAEMLIQKSLFLFEQRMTESEAKRERKEAYGDPQIRKERRRRMKEEPLDPDAIGVERANLCFHGPSGAVAIRYHPQQARIPRISARASGEAGRALHLGMAGAGLVCAESEQIVRGCRTAEPGSALSPDLYEIFAESLKTAMRG